MSWTTLPDLVQIGTFFATVAVAVIAWWELKQLRAQSTTAFEDSLTEEYRRIMESIPTDVWLGSELETLEGEQRQRCRDAIYRYIDLSNEQAFLHREGRVRPETWRVWREGIIFNMALPAFHELWKEVAHKAPAAFEFLRDLLP